VQIAETFKLIREILTQQIVPRQTACSSTGLPKLFSVAGHFHTGLPDISWEKKPNHVWKKAKPGEKKPNC